MSTILQINNSVFGDQGQSSRLTDTFVSQLRAGRSDTRIIRRDLSAATVPHLTADRFAAALTDPAERTAEQAREAALADTLVEELLSADLLVIGVPTYNFNIPSPLKAWFDHVARAGTTFRYTAAGPEGLLQGKKAYVFVTSGGRHAGTETDFAAPYLRQILGFLGIEDVVFTHAEGLALGEEASRESLVAATARIQELAA